MACVDPEETAEPVRPAQGPDPAVLGEAVRALSARRGWDARLEGAEIHARWAEVAGDQLARHTEPVRLAGGVLVLRASDSAWATQVRYLAADLTRRANAVLGKSLVERITVVAGSARSPGGPRRP